MSNQTRVTAGIPTGGQFAGTNRPESDVALDGATPARDEAGIDQPGVDQAWMDAETAELEADMERLHQMSDRIELRAARLLAATIRSTHPQARYASLEVTDQGGTSMWFNGLTDADGKTIDSEDLSDSDEINYLAGCLTERGAWQAAESDDMYGDLDLDKAVGLGNAATAAPGTGEQQPEPVTGPQSSQDTFYSRRNELRAVRESVGLAAVALMADGVQTKWPDAGHLVVRCPQRDGQEFEPVTALGEDFREINSRWGDMTAPDVDLAAVACEIDGEQWFGYTRHPTSDPNLRRYDGSDPTVRVMDFAAVRAGTPVTS